VHSFRLMGLDRRALCNLAVLLLLASTYAQKVFEPHGLLLSNRASFKLALSSSPQSIQKLASLPSFPSKSILQNGTASASNVTVKLEVCMDCVTFMQANLVSLMNIVTKIGVADTCSKICDMLNDSVDVVACESLCEAVNVTFFWQMFVSVGINPIWACEMLSACAAAKCPAVSFTAALVSPEAGPPGTTFEFKMQFTVVNETGVGETAFVIYYPIDGTHNELGYISQQVFPNYSPGEYVITLPFPTNASFVTGKYLIIFDLCSGACGLDPDPIPFAHEEYSFNITGANS